MKSICVFCGSSPGRDPRYLESTMELGRRVAAGGMTLVYGGARVGLMGAVASAALEAGGRVIGVLPAVLGEREIEHIGLSELHRVGTMHERKAKMADLADAFVALPGGLGTLEELFEVATWSYLEIHRKPFGLLNVNGYYDSLMTFLERSVHDGFVRQEIFDRFIVDEDAGRLLGRLR